MKNVLKFSVISLLLILLLTSCNLNFFNIKDISKIVITDSENTYKTSKKEDIKYLVSLFKKAKPFTGNPSCPFEYLKITIYHKNGKKYILNYASDLCPIFKYKNIPYIIDDDSNKYLRRFLKENGIRDNIW